MARQDEDVRTACCSCVGAAACAGWWTLLIGFLLLLVSGVFYMIIVHTPFLEAVAMIWGVGPKAVTVVTLAFMGLFKLFLLFWLLVCVFLTALAYRMRSGEETE
jgi:hypothetical protein